MVFSPQPHRGSPGLFAPDPRGGAIGTAALPSHSALIVNLGCQHASAVPHNHTPQRVHGSFPIVGRGPDNAVRDRQRKRNAVLPALALLPGVGFAAQLYSLDTPTYVPSKAVVADPGACAAAGIANQRDAIINAT